MGCISKVCRKIFVGLLSLIKVGICIAIIVIVAVHLTNLKVTGNGFGKINVACLMAGNVNGDSVCNYTYAVCGISMFVSFCSSILLCITCDLCGLGDWFEFILGVFQTAWWVIAAIIISKNVRDSNEWQGVGLPKEGWRNAVAILAWINVLIAAILTLIWLVQACKCLRKCCSCCCGDDDDSHKGRNNAV